MCEVSPRIRSEALRLDSWDNSEAVRELLTVLGEGDILEVGCGTGSVLQELGKQLENSHFTGLDLEAYFIRVAQRKSLKKTVFITGDAVDRLLPADSFDYVFYKDSFKEIRRHRGLCGVIATIGNTFSYLRNGGRVIIRDGFNYTPQPMRISFTTDETQRVFDYFIANHVQPPEITWDNGTTELSLPYLISYLGKYTRMKDSPTPRNVMNTPSLSLHQYDKLLTGAGFMKETVKTYPFPPNLIPEGIIIEPEIPDTYTMLVYRKP